VKFPKSLFIIAAAILIKLSLFILIEVHSPDSRFEIDSSRYLETGQVLISQGAFATRGEDGSLHYEFRRTPGYPVFLGILNQFMKIPIGGVIFIQVLLTILIGLIVYKTACEIDSKLAFLSAAIVLYSPVISIFSLIILTETLFLFFITLFMFYFVRYIKSGEIKCLLASALMVVLAAYVRPGAYFLGLAMAAFMVYSNVSGNIKKTICHVVILLIVVYGLLGIWQFRNYMIFKSPIFCSIFQENSGFFNGYFEHASRLVHSVGELQYYGGIVLKGLGSLLIRPVSFKYFHSYPLMIIGQILGYAWAVFLMGGFVYGIARIGRNACYQFFLFVIVCFIYGSMIGAAHYLGGRFRVPMEPFIAIISAYGWQQLILLAKTLQNGVLIGTMKT